MDGSPPDQARDHLKVLLLHLAARYDNPSEELQDLLREVIGELHEEVERAIGARSRLRLIEKPPQE